MFGTHLWISMEKMTSYYYVGSWLLLKPNRMVMMWQSVVKGLCQVQGKHVPLHLHNRHQSVSCLSNIVFWNLSNKCFGSLCVTNCVRDKCASSTIVCILLSSTELSEHQTNMCCTRQTGIGLSRSPEICTLYTFLAELLLLTNESNYSPPGTGWLL